MSVYFSNDDIGKIFQIKKKDGEIIEGRLVDIDPIIKIVMGDKEYRFLEAKIDEVYLIKENPLDFQINLSKTPISEFLDMLKNIKLEYNLPTFSSLKKELVELKKDKELHSLYLELQKIFNSLTFAYENNQMDFKYDKTNRLLYKLDDLYQEWDDELIDKFIVFILDHNKTSYTDFFGKEPEPTYYHILLYDANFFYKKNKLEKSFLLMTILFNEFPLSEELKNEWLFYIENVFQFKKISPIETQLSRFYEDLSEGMKKILKYSVLYLIYKFNIPLNDLQREYLKSINLLAKKELIELINILGIYVSSKSADEDYKIEEVKRKLDKFLNNFEYLKAYEFIKGMSKYFNSSEFDKLYNEISGYYKNWIAFKDQLPSGESVNYIKAKKAQLIEKNYKKAKFYFELSIDEKEEKFKSAIKDYIQMSRTYKKEDTIKLINNYKSFFSQEEKIKFNNLVLPFIKEYDKTMYLQTINQLLNQIESKEIWKKKYIKIYGYYLIEAAKIYEEKGEYSKAIKYLLNAKEVVDSENKVKCNILIANNYKRIKNFDEAKKYLNENIEKYADQESYILLNEMKDDIFDSSIFKVDNSINRLDVEKFLNIYIKQCKFIGVSSTKANNKNFTEKDLEDVVKLDNIKSAQEKAERLLTAYVIANTLKKENAHQYLAKSLRFYANYFVSQNKFDIGKNFLLASLFVDYKENVLVDYFKVIIEKDIHRKDYKINLFDYIRSIVINDELKIGLTYLYFGIPSVFEKLSFSEDLIKKEINIFKEIKDNLNLLKNKNSLIENVNLNFCLDKLFLVDKEFFIILEEILDLIREYRNRNFSSFNDNMYLLEKILNKLNNLKTDIKEQLTIFGAILLEIIEYLIKQVNDEIEKIKMSKKAILHLSSPIEKYNKNENVEFHLSISNEKDLADAIINLIEIYNEDEIIESIEPSIRIKGGESKTIQIPLNIKAKETFSIKVRVTFESCDEINEIENSFSINVEDSEFVSIDNPYTPDGQIVKNKNMFFGRDELMKNLIEQFKDDKIQALVLYGQKRVGKSTVFHYLEEELNSEFFVINITSLGSVDDIDDFIEKLKSSIEDKFDEVFNEDIYDVFKYFDEITYKNIEKLLKDLKEYLIQKNSSLLVLIDEFTYLYEKIKENKMDTKILRLLKSLLQQSLIKLGVIGQNSMPLFINDFPNELAVFRKIKISYLDKKSSFELLENPILLEGKSRYKDDSLEYIYELTNGSPFYLQKIGFEIVEYLNEKKFNYITRATVERVINKMFENISLEGEFDNIISLGNGVDKEIENLRKEAILQIAKKSRIYGSVDFDSIDLNCPLDKKKEVIQTLIDTDVVNVINNRFSLKVKLLEKYIQNKLGGM